MSTNLKIAPSAVKEAARSRAREYDEVAIMREAEVLRSEAMADLLHRLGRRIRAAFGRIARSIEDARAMQELSRLDDRTLADIGISRSDIPRVVLGMGETGPTTAAEPHEPRRAA